MTDEQKHRPESNEAGEPNDVGHDANLLAPERSEEEPSSDVGNSPTGQSPFKDRRAGLIIFGIVQIVMGACCAMLIPLMLMGLRANAGGAAAVNVRMVIPIIGIYAPLAVALVWLGIGSIMARRWARALILIESWMWLVVGLVSFVTIVPPMLRMFNQGLAGRQLPPSGAMYAQAIVFAVFCFMYVTLPGAFVLFYRSPHVKATCDAADPHVRWTDKCPLPVLALSLLLAFGSLSMTMTLSYGGVFPFFGMLLTGPPAIVTSLAIGILFAYLAWGTYKLKMSAWWITLIVYTIFLSSSVITFSLIDMMGMYRAMDFPEEQLKAIQQAKVIENMNMPVQMGIWLVLNVGYLLWVRKDFVAWPGPPEV